ncbi:calcium/sodium antiporter [Gilvimarinus agarilyticus]|uniref:calcium/sodium antiporter n=1 Tax=unclassified Gilvimarinus TaxID=2642066 RepID=UPI001C091A4C|nr:MULTISPECIES: calcium/sodium antiporter [unclassified Gilvimarinus]MBU2885447.1 calcium/sodium antiporter [Gilvimarinus agarilyticus]MDO6570347.1 calcium/sodium antiporter [Gilvimarinus sp. 2_MG-2023]MDO6746866.1 calcium/sodium antiporter [Gilvimarinus sp. 1_MG-2023]
MTDLWLPALLVLVGFAGLIWSADKFVGGAAALANNYGVSKLIIGLTIVALGTSAPEVLVSLNASLQGQGDLAIGNALGSNLANIGLVLGATALIAALPVQNHLLKTEMPVLLLITALAGWFLWDAHLSRGEGVALLLALPCAMALIIWSKRHHPEEIDDDIPNMSRGRALFWFVFGLAALVVSSDILVRGASDLALHFGVSPLVIGLTVVAVGTSLPELAASVTSALKGHHDIAIGNVIGSNLFNLLAVMSLPGVIAPLAMEPAVFHRDYLAMAALTALLALALLVSAFVYRRRGGPRLGKLMGVVFLAIYAGYYFILLG